VIGRRPAVTMLVVAFTLAACVDGAGSSIERAAPPVEGEPVIYVAIGASETAGVGTPEPFTEAWPKVLWREALPEAVLYDLGRPGSTLAEALVDQLGDAVALDPDVVSVWLNVNDIVDRVPADVYGGRLRKLLASIGRTGAVVLVATTPQLDTLPLYLACRPSPPVDGPACPAPELGAVRPAEIRAAVAAYNRTIERVAAETDAVVVDLGLYGDAPTEHPGWISEDGFHPSAEGAVAIAQAFQDALPRAVIDAAAMPR
jgi:lysophospholipase L1-like esterase